jgi:hypothetical protein
MTSASTLVVYVSVVYVSARVRSVVPEWNVAPVPNPPHLADKPDQVSGAGSHDAADCVATKIRQSNSPLKI